MTQYGLVKWYYSSDTTPPYGELKLASDDGMRTLAGFYGENAGVIDTLLHLASNVVFVNVIK